MPWEDMPTTPPAYGSNRVRPNPVFRMPVRKVKVLKYPDGKVIDLSRWFGKTKNRIARLGIEVEGGWHVAPSGLNVHGDGSVSVTAADTTSGNRLEITGEISSVPIEPIQMKKWMRHAYPDAVNKSCGLHVHMSFKRSAHYSRLMSPDYLETLIDGLRKFGEEEGLPDNHELFKRLNGSNTYCAKKFWPDAQAIQKKKVYGTDSEGGRYTILNYCWGLNARDGSPGTLEVRVMPMFKDKEMAIRAIERLMDITNAFLSATAQKEKPYKIIVESAEEGVVNAQEIFLRRPQRNWQQPSV